MRLFCPVFLVLTLSWAAVAQTGAPQPASGDAVPDDVAFQLFFAAVAENATLAPADAARQDSRLKPIHLTAADKAALVASLATLKANLAAAQNAAQPTPAAAVVEGALNQLLGKMSPDGFQRLIAYVRSQKTAMMVVTSPSPVASGSSAATHNSAKATAQGGKDNPRR